MSGRDRLLASVAVCIVVATATHGATARELGMRTWVKTDGAPVTSCDDDGISVSFTTSGGFVTQVTARGIAGACAGGRLTPMVTDAAGAMVGSGGPQAVTGSSVTVPLNPRPAASAVAGIHVVIEGP